MTGKAIVLSCLLGMTGLCRAGDAVRTALQPELYGTVSSQAPFAANRLEIVKLANDRASRGLIRFDLSGLDAAAAGDVGRATLSGSLRIKGGKGPLPPLELAALRQAWNERADWQFSDGRTSWPLDRNKYYNIDNSLDWAGGTAWTIDPEAETYNIDITDEVRRWLYMDRPNYGLLLRVGGIVHGTPSEGDYAITLGEPTLTIELNGQPPTPAQPLQPAIRHYPSALLPPVSVPYIFHIFNGIPQQHRDSLINSGDVSGVNPSAGYLTLSWIYGPNNPYIETEAEFIKCYLDYRDAMGLQVDEWQGKTRLGAEINAQEDPNVVKNNAKIDHSVAGILAAKQARPEQFIAVYWRGEDSIEPLIEAGQPDLLIVECQSHLKNIYNINWGVEPPDMLRRVEYARRLGVIERTIPLIGMFEKTADFHPEKILTAAEVEELIKMFRQAAPEMPGLAFYGGSSPEFMAEAEAIARRYFVAPAPEVIITQPAYGATEQAMKTEFRAEAKARDGRSIQRYDWFIDGDLIQQDVKPQFVIDNRALAPGRHIVTCQAVDSGWNRAAAQLEFNNGRN
ncbi:Ig-like domain-containing protein [Victivallis sp. Marseille-Q1083]|uniref:Ig-like domain-containing protein n=1 Tax=Victivallis sp. Marseille-Q1083 TaxID=2717288 RepID=UPI00158EC28B|nr:Ig-like domain-containing protein [Victivallis sp. Marseille-Q1083]